MADMSTEDLLALDDDEILELLAREQAEGTSTASMDALDPDREEFERLDDLGDQEYFDMLNGGANGWGMTLTCEPEVFAAYVRYLDGSGRHGLTDEQRGQIGKAFAEYGSEMTLARYKELAEDIGCTARRLDTEFRKLRIENGTAQTHAKPQRLTGEQRGQIGKAFAKPTCRRQVAWSTTATSPP